MKKTLLMGEPMALLVAKTLGPLDEIEDFTRMLAGAEVNVCIALRRLGLNPSYITHLGKDPMGKFIHTRLQNEGIDTTYVSFDDSYLTGLQFKGKVESGDPAIFYFRKNSAFSHISMDVVDKVDFSDVAHLHLTGIPPALSPECRAATKGLLQKAKKNNTYVSFDPNLRTPLWENPEVMKETINALACEADMVLPGLEEAKLLTGKTTPQEMADFYRKNGVSTVVIKHGSKGAWLVDDDGCELIEGFKIDKVIDTVGAGDGFASGVISGRLDGISMREAVRRGNAIGAIQVTHVGDNEGLPTRKELEAFMQR